MKITNSKDAQARPSLVMLCYGEGGVGKTTFSTTAPNPLLVDCENGGKYLGLRGIDVDRAIVEKWSDMKDVLEFVKLEKYETIVIDPVGELMDKLKRYMLALNDSKLSQKDGSPTMAGWGWLKKTLREYIKVLRDSGKNVILVAHLDEKDDEGRLVKRPKIETKLSDDLVNMVDVVAYMTVVQGDGETKRVLIVDPGNDKYTAKDRTGQLGKIIEPDFRKIVNACNGTEKYAWSAPTAVLNKPVDSAPAAPVATEPTPVKKGIAKPQPKEEAKDEIDSVSCVDCFEKDVNTPLTDEVLKFSSRMFKRPLCRACQKEAKENGK